MPRPSVERLSEGPQGADVSARLRSRTRCIRVGQWSSLGELPGRTNGHDSYAGLPPPQRSIHQTSGIGPRCGMDSWYGETATVEPRKLPPRRRCAVGTVLGVSAPTHSGYVAGSADYRGREFLPREHTHGTRRAAKASASTLLVTVLTVVLAACSSNGPAGSSASPTEAGGASATTRVSAARPSSSSTFTGTSVLIDACQKTADAYVAQLQALHRDYSVVEHTLWAGPGPQSQIKGTYQDLASNGTKGVGCELSFAPSSKIPGLESGQDTTTSEDGVFFFIGRDNGSNAAATAAFSHHLSLVMGQGGSTVSLGQLPSGNRWIAEHCDGSQASLDQACLISNLSGEATVPDVWGAYAHVSDAAPHRPDMTNGVDFNALLLGWLTNLKFNGTFDRYRP
jgi:hypothetical protein